MSSHRPGRGVVVATVALALAADCLQVPVWSSEGMFRPGETVYVPDEGYRECRVVAVDPHGVFVMFPDAGGNYHPASARRRYVQRWQLRHQSGPEPAQPPAYQRSNFDGSPSFESGPVVPMPAKSGSAYSSPPGPSRGAAPAADAAGVSGSATGSKKPAREAGMRAVPGRLNLSK